MDAAINWSRTLQVIATVAAAASALAAWRAASASRDAARAQQLNALVGDLHELHERLTVLGLALGNDIDYHAFEQFKPGLGRHLAVIDEPLPNTRRLWRIEVPGKIEDSFDAALRSTYAKALREVEDALVTVRHPARRWWQRRRPRRVPRVYQSHIDD